MGPDVQLGKAWVKGCIRDETIIWLPEFNTASPSNLHILLLS